MKFTVEEFRTKSIDMLSIAAEYYEIKVDPRRYGYYRAIESIKYATEKQLNGNFNDIYGVGPSIGMKLQHLRDNYEYPDSIKDMLDEMANLKQEQSTNPHKHYMPRKEAEAITYRLRDFIYQSGVSYYITGSYRRGARIVGDMDLLVVNNGNETFVDTLIDWCLDEGNQTGITLTAKGSKKLKLIFHEYETNKELLECDVRFCDAEELGTMLLYFTGPASYNIALRRKARSIGYKLSEYGVTELKTGDFHKFVTEAKVQEFLVVDELRPEERR